jgi:hypothetical protein
MCQKLVGGGPQNQEKKNSFANASMAIETREIQGSNLDFT